MRVASLLLFIFLQNIVFGQQRDDSRFLFAPVLGFNVSQIDGDMLAGFYKLGIHAGGMVYVKLTDDGPISLSMEMLFNQKGSSTRPGRVPKSKILLNYVDIPVQINYHDKDRMIFGLGANYARMINAKTNLGITDDFDSREVGYLVTITFMAKEHLGIGLRYSGSISSFGTAANPDTELINRSITLRLSYLL
ncbi:MAG: hypothetical protein ACI959_001180 [Limisphaerales bacterium]|jgi:hypothetical protein